MAEAPEKEQPSKEICVPVNAVLGKVTVPDQSQL